MIRPALLALTVMAVTMAVTMAVPAVQPVLAAQSPQVQAGTYELSITYGGGLLEATLEIGYKGDSITAVLKLGDHQSPVKPGKRTGNKLVLEPVSPSMDVRYELEFNGESVKGTFTYNGERGELSGKRRRAER